MLRLTGALGFLFLLCAPAYAADPPPPPPKVIELIELLQDPAVRDWIVASAAAAKAAPADAAAAPTPTPIDLIEERLRAIGTHGRDLATALPTLPQQFGQAGEKLLAELRLNGFGRSAFLLLLFVALAIGAELAMRAITARTQRTAEHRIAAGTWSRLQYFATAYATGAAAVLAFAIGGVASFMLFDWPPLLRQVAMVSFVALVGFRLVRVTLRAFLQPAESGDTRPLAAMRAMPVSDAASRFWFGRLSLLLGWLAFGWGLAYALDILGFSPPARRLVAYALGVGLLVVALECTWNSRRHVASTLPRGTGWRWLLTAAFVLMWLSWVIGRIPGFWFFAVAAALPLGIGVGRRAIRHLFDVPTTGEAAPTGSAPSVVAVCVERAFNACLMIGGAWLLLRAWGISPGEIFGAGTAETRLLRGAFHAFIIILVFDLCWHLLKAVMDKALLSARSDGAADTELVRRQARVRTLLPILRNIAFIVLLVMGALMALAALGVEIGPLIASAGVVGVAVGFGAQTLVRDVFSGIFYLLDDAFRVGEYIQSGSYKGVVESFSLRSIKLRHQRGPLFTVPFGTLGAIQNMSRDWVIDKMTIGVVYGSDLEKVKKLIKQIGKELAENPEYSADILEPLKMQGVEEFGDYAIKIRLKLMTRPGKQFVIRRRANFLIKKAFDANGIQFAMPMVHVAGGDDATAAVAQKALDAINAAEAKAADKA